MLTASCLFNFPPTTATSPLSLHDALPICDAEHFDHRLGALAAPAGRDRPGHAGPREVGEQLARAGVPWAIADRKSTRLNSSHVKNSYAVFCLKKKSNTEQSCSVCGREPM